MRIPFRSTMVLEGERESALRIYMNKKGKNRRVQSTLKRWYRKIPAFWRRVLLGSLLLGAKTLVGNIFGWHPEIEDISAAMAAGVLIDKQIVKRR